MPRTRQRVNRGRGVVILAIALCTGLIAGCDDNGDTIIIDGLDCGLIRDDLIGSWVVTFVDGSTGLIDCDGALPVGVTDVDVGGGSVTYSDVRVVASPSSSSFVVSSDGPNSLVNELIASVEADSCLALVQIWEQDDSGWVQCFGTFDRAFGTFSAICDSVEFETSGDRSPDVACTLVDSLFVQFLIP